MKLDTVTLEIISHKFTAIADEMTLNLKRASRSLFVKEASDFGTGLIDREGHMFAFPAATSVSAIERYCMPTISRVPALEDGDVILTNDPYRSEGLATHLPDLHMIKPFFHEGEIIAYAWAFVHFMDVGGRVPASVAPSNTEVFQEGLIIPPTKVVRRGTFNEDILGVIAANSRTPDQNLSDLKAMVGAMEMAGRRIAELVERHGVDTFLAAQSQIQDYAAAKAREVLRRIPEFWDYLDDDLVTRIPVRYRVRMVVRDGEVEVDATGTDPQTRTSYNLTTAGRDHPWFFVKLTQFILSFDRSIPLNYGIYRHLKAINPAGTVMNAEFPDPVGVRHSSSHRFNDALNGAMVKALPDLMSAPTAGIIVPVVLAEADNETGNRAISVIQPLVGGRGAYVGDDGVDARDNSAANLSNHPIETTEAEIGAIVRRYDIRADSGGAGRWRGGVGQVLSFEVTREDGVILARGMDRMRFTAWGYRGGMPGARLRVVINEGLPGEREVGKIDVLPVHKGDIVTFYAPGGGGYGDPFARDIEKVERDVLQGFVSLEGARRDYGVVIGDDGKADLEATRILRASRNTDQPGEEFHFDEERAAWDAVFDDATMQRLNAALYALPKSKRQGLRQRFFEQVVPAINGPERPLFAEVLGDRDAARTRVEQAFSDIFASQTA